MCGSIESAEWELCPGAGLTGDVQPGPKPAKDHLSLLQVSLCILFNLRARTFPANQSNFSMTEQRFTIHVLAKYIGLTHFKDS